MCVNLYSESTWGKKFNRMRMWLINQCCFCIWCTDNTEQRCISVKEISASEYIRHKKRGHSDARIYELTGYHY